MKMSEFLVVGMGGFLGSCLRFGFTKLANQFSFQLPFGTLISNVLAGLLIGFIIGIEQQSTALNPHTKLFLTTGFLGGLSTFSTFSLETVNLFQEGKIFLATGNVALNLALSLLGVAIGMTCAKLLKKA
ncbi:MAG: fluoride efflux transporter CrcB [Clostridiales Family XIII bacterium]|jgi:CrcB protein|nr:fluoride efflux transporter CrcB [Clostridiales Family XIII bacterium]